MPTQKQFYTTVGAYTIGFGLGAIRLAGAQTWQDFVITGALTAAELGVVKVIEVKTATLEDKQQVWLRKEEERGIAVAAVRVAEERYAALCSQRQKTIDEMERLERECEDEFLLSDQKGLAAICTAAMMRGYRRGIAHNAGIFLGRPGAKEEFDDE